MTHGAGNRRHLEKEEKRDKAKVRLGEFKVYRQVHETRSRDGWPDSQERSENPAFSSTFHCFYLLPQTCVDLSESLPHWKRKKYWRLVSLIWFFQLEWNAVILVKSSFCFVISHSDINKHIFTQTI